MHNHSYTSPQGARNARENQKKEGGEQAPAPPAQVVSGPRSCGARRGAAAAEIPGMGPLNSDSSPSDWTRFHIISLLILLPLLLPLVLDKNKNPLIE